MHLIVVIAQWFVKMPLFSLAVWHLYRPFYQYGGHIELIRFKEYYRMPRGKNDPSCQGA